MELCFKSLVELNRGLVKKEYSCKELLEYFIKRQKAGNEKFNFSVRIADQALSQAEEIDRKKDFSNVLTGIPLGVKDLFCTKGLKTTASSKILENFIPPYTATCVGLLEEQGMIVSNKLNMDEFAMGSSNETSNDGLCRNPWNRDYVPGGSSGGSAAAVAGGWVPVALGSDTGGSVRQPAHFCGVTGIKPTYGSVSRFGMVAFASSLDQAGVFGGSLEDCALVLDPMMAIDKKDGTTSGSQPGSILSSENLDISSLRVGIPKNYFSLEIDEDIRSGLEAILKDMEARGATLVDIELPHSHYAVPVYYLIATSEASSNLSRYDGIRFGFRASMDSQGREIKDLETLYCESRSQGFGPEVQRRILLGTYSLSSGYYDAYFIKAAKVRRLIAQDFVAAYEKCDVIFGPVATSTAFPIGDKIKDPLAMYYNDIFTTPASLAGLPALSLPVGMSDEGLPYGAQLIGAPWSESKLLQVGQWIENQVNFNEHPRVD